MPLYEYLCEKCGAVFELIEKFSAEPKTVHEGCGGAVHRLISAPALQFKGSGFYITDYGKGGTSKSDASRHAAEGKNESKKSGDDKKKSDSKSSSSDSSSSSSSSTPATPSSSSSGSSSSSSSPSSSDSGSKS